MTRLIAIAALFASSAAAEWAPDQVLISYQVRVPGGEISGVSRELQWKVDALPGDRSQVHFGVPVRSFDSGHPKFDAAVRAALADDRYPDVQLDGVVGGGRFEGTLSLRGTSRAVSFPIRIDNAGSFLIASGAFDLELTDLGAPIPGVAPRAKIEFTARLAVSPAAVLAGGYIGAQD